MSRQGNKYERTVAFSLIVFRGAETEKICLQDEMVLPVSKKQHAVTLKNVEVYIEELISSDQTITAVRLDRISHIKIYQR